MMAIPKRNLLPLIFTAVAIIVDQLTKYLVTITIPVNTIGTSVFGDFFRIIHVQNTGIAFSMGHSWPPVVRIVAFGIIPLAVIVLMLWYAVKTRELTTMQRWLIAGIGGGGIGNLIDRFFRATGVVDFIDIKFYGLFGMERWPTFNIADSCVMVCGIWLFISVIITSSKHSGVSHE